MERVTGTGGVIIFPIPESVIQVEYISFCGVSIPRPQVP